MRNKVAKELRKMVKTLFTHRPWESYEVEERQKSMLIEDNYVMVPVKYVKLSDDCGKRVYRGVKYNYKVADHARSY